MNAKKVPLLKTNEEQHRKSRPDEDGIENGIMVGIECGIEIRTKRLFGIGIRNGARSKIRAGLLNPNLLSPRPGSELKAKLRSKSKVRQIGIEIRIGIEIVNGRYIR
ncbi:hypothetical protein EVAR_34445_1 [Eumeta japonica]|uniref:Uncharacterized protein n=1 Tax=Eumeta variegata TaxID=151549 RepID=A0A4C1WMN0_EUMVA|nr:hypothetical protein EVAR_34445_1 [Eumeta japonica]